MTLPTVSPDNSPPKNIMKSGVNIQPAPYQIANYNIFPVPTLGIPDHWEVDTNSYAQLVEVSKQVIVKDGIKVKILVLKKVI